MIHKPIKLSFLALLLPGMLYAQNVKKLSLQEAVQLGIANSKNLKLSQNKIDEAVARLNVVKDNVLPSASASFIYNHAEIPTNTLSIGGGDPIHLPKRADAFVGTAAVEEVIYGGGRLKLATESTRLLTEVAKLDADKDQEEISYVVINTYYSLYKIAQSKKVIAQNLDAIASQLKQAQRFFEQGIVTKNDVLRFQLQQANVTLTQLEAENNRKIINYNLDILLGLPENTDVEITEPDNGIKTVHPLNSYVDMGLSTRQELRQLDLRNQVAEVNVKSIKANTLPTVGVGANLYYINPSGGFIPPANQFIVPVTLGATVSWNIGTLWNNKNKVSEARVQQKSVVLEKDVQSDNVKTEINRNYQNYQLAVNKIQILETSIAQASENDRLLESKYKNNVASAIDRIDAETLLYQSKINLEIAKADAGLAYYTLLKSTGKISQ
ncbi:TolC family protein [Pedobacter duraquae]|uniref:Outer membrane protein TolC n=1 Tax=Pedobacter duraquae TaxID=425511 RepID=A0A4V3C2P4_9SPHI|nr:TolC family protein [Pedobacter duraquae]TDO19189.1 outer membrane protein TolC [Pedobacter duraquae]